MRPRNDTAQAALPALLRRGPAGVSTLAGEFGVTSRTVLRWLAERDDICSAGAASRTRYALQRPLRGRLERYPLYRIDERGKVAEAGSLVPVYPGGVLCSFRELGWPVDDASLEGWWEGLPYPLYDMRPQGFLGRTFAREHHALLEIPPDPRRWGDDDILHILTRTGWDTSGNLILGESALRRWQADLLDPAPSIPEDRLLDTYAERANGVAALGMAGPSAGGEFPKFPALRTLPGAATDHVIVKFSGEIMPGATQRWSDLLVCEHLATRHLAQLPGVTGARSRILQGHRRTFLESERFDRIGRFGRTPLVSLESVNGHLLGIANEDWRVPARRLVQMKLLGPAGLEAISRLWWFGRLIANNDMHMGNLSFIPEAGGFRVAPAYDMLPMAYAPLPGGEVPSVAPQFGLPLPSELDAWLDACRCAITFWEDAGADARISAPFRAICSENGASLRALLQKIAPS